MTNYKYIYMNLTHLVQINYFDILDINRRKLTHKIHKKNKRLFGNAVQLVFS